MLPSFFLVLWLAQAPLPSVPVLELDRDRLTAADLARRMPQWRQLPPDTEILYAPLPGLNRELARGELERLAARHGLDPGPGDVWPSRLRLVRRLRVLEAREAEAAVATAVALQHRVSPEDVSVELSRWIPIRIPTGEIAMRAQAPFPRGPDPVPVALTWTTRDRRSGTLWLRARIQVRGLYAVAARRIAAGEPLRSPDVRFEEGALGGPPGLWRLSAAELEGAVLRRSLEQGERISRLLVIQRPAVERGALVELRLARGPIELRAPGRAERAARLGEILTFRNLQSGRSVTARLVAPGRAEVESASIAAGAWRGNGGSP